MLIVEIGVDTAILATALERAPEMVLENEEEYIAGDDVRLLFWAAGGDFEAFEAGVDADSTVTARRTLADLDDRRLYRVYLTKEGLDRSTLPIWRDLEVIPLEVTGSHEGWCGRVRIPDRERLETFLAALRDRDLDFEIRSLYDEADARSAAEASLTEAQIEALVTAYEAGYYDVPRSASQAEVAAELGIAPQSLSGRLRQGSAAPIETTLVEG